jgi:hypothetical protein
MMLGLGSERYSSSTNLPPFRLTHWIGRVLIIELEASFDSGGYYSGENDWRARILETLAGTAGNVKLLFCRIVAPI